MTLRTKKSAMLKGANDVAQQRPLHRIPLPHNSVFSLGPATNRRWLHGIRPDKRLITEKTTDERAYDGERISLTFRLIGTFTDSARMKIWGQGARSKKREDAGDVLTEIKEMEAMVMAFGKENQKSDFDWDAEYGRGFDALNLEQNAGVKA